jgi:segregation and condensation protein B
MSEQRHQLKSIIEAALLVAQAPLTIDKVAALFPEDARPGRDEIREALDELQNDYADRGIELRRIENTYRFQSRAEFSPWLNKLWEGRPARYSRALLETLAIIAYRQPVTRGEIEEIRGVGVSSEIVKTLLNREWIRQVGYRDIPGKPALFGTTRGFLEHFNLKGLGELPSLAEIRDADTIARELNLSLALEDNMEPAAGEADEQATQASTEEAQDTPEAQEGSGDEPDDSGESDEASPKAEEASAN